MALYLNKEKERWGVGGGRGMAGGMERGREGETAVERER